MSMINLRAKLLAITGEPHDISMLVKTDSTEWQIKISQEQMSLIKSHIVSMEKKINQEHKHEGL